MRSTADARAGFTLIELLIVVAVIAVLIALLMPALTMLKKRGRIAATEARIQQVTMALTDYLNRYPVLGNTTDSTDFMAAPYKFLNTNFIRMNESALIELPLNQLAMGSGTYQNPTIASEGEHILDAFPSAAHDNILQFSVVNLAVLGLPQKKYTDKVVIRSTAGTPADPKDDIVWRYTSAQREWHELKGDERTDPLNTP